MHLTLFEDVSFDGTYIDFDIVIADGSGLIPQTGLILNTDFSITLYDSAGASDAATITSTEVTGTGIYKIRTTYANLNRTALGGTAGDGIWRWVFSRINPDLTFEPKAVSITFNMEMGTATGTPTTTTCTFTGLASADVDHYKDSMFRVIARATGVAGEVKKTTANTSGGQLTFNAMSVALANGDKILIINR